MKAPSYFEHVEGQPQLDVVPWEDPEEITVIERALTQEEVDRMRAQFESIRQPVHEVRQ